MKKNIRLRLFSLCSFLVLFTSLSITIPFYSLFKQDKEDDSRVRIRIAFDIVRYNIKNRINDTVSRLDEFFKQVSAIPWELTWYAKINDKKAFFSDPTYSSYINTIGEEFIRFGRFISANRILLYGPDRRLLVSCHLDGEGESAEAYIVTQEGQNSYLSINEYSKYLITRQPLPESPLPVGLSEYYSGPMPKKVLSGNFCRGSRLGLQIIMPIRHEGKILGLLITESFYTQEMVERYAELSRTDINLFSGYDWSMGTLAGQKQLSTDQNSPFANNNLLHPIVSAPLISTVNIGQRDYYHGTYALSDPWGKPIGVITASISKDAENTKMAKMLKSVSLIAFIACIVAFILTVILTRKSLLSIQMLTASAAEIANGNLQVEINTNAPAEFGVLASSFAQMRESIIGQIGQLQSEILKHKKTTEGLQESEGRLAATLRSIEDGVITCDMRGMILSLNVAAEKCCGWSSVEAIGKPVGDVFNTVDAQTGKAMPNLVSDVLASKEPQRPIGHMVLLSRDESSFFITESCAPIFSMEGGIFGAVLVFHDVTGALQLQEQLSQSQKMDAIGQLAGGIAHDFNNMLGGVLGCAELLSRRIVGDETSENYLAMIFNATEQASELAKGLLAFSQKQSTASTPIDINDVIMDTVGLLRNTIDKRISVVTALCESSSVVIGDNSQLQSVFLNLGINASHAMADGGTLTFSSKKITLSNVFCQASPFDLSPGEYIEIEVRDTGSGIPPEILPRIFEPFFTTKEQGKGTGLGLAATYGTIRQHHGAITVYSEIGAGTVFHLLFPLSVDVVCESICTTDMIHGEGVILLVDDELIMRNLGEIFLKELGYEVVLAENGKVAIELFMAKAQEIDLVMLDMIMPEMNGRDCFMALKKIRSDIPIIISSGFSQNKDLEDLKKCGLSGFIKKPYHEVELSVVVAEALHRVVKE